MSVLGELHFDPKSTKLMPRCYVDLANICLTPIFQCTSTEGGKDMAEKSMKVTNEENSFERAWAEAVVRVWRQGDEGFRQKLLNDPKSAFAELGAKVPDGVEVHIIEN